MHSQERELKLGGKGDNMVFGGAAMKEMTKKKGQKTGNPFKGVNFGFGKSIPTVKMPKGGLFK